MHWQYEIQNRPKSNLLQITCSKMFLMWCSHNTNTKEDIFSVHLSFINYRSHFKHDRDPNLDFVFLLLFLTIMCESCSISTPHSLPLSSRAALKGLKSTRQERVGVTPFSLFFNRDSALSSLSQITIEISAREKDFRNSVISSRK